MSSNPYIQMLYRPGGWNQRPSALKHWEIIYTWVENGFKHKNNKCNTALNCCSFTKKFYLIAIVFLFFGAKNKYHTFFSDLQKTPTKMSLTFVRHIYNKNQFIKNLLKD